MSGNAYEEQCMLEKMESEEERQEEEAVDQVKGE